MLTTLNSNKTPAWNSPSFLVMLVITAGLASMYLHLRSRFLELSVYCDSLQRVAKESQESGNHCINVNFASSGNENVPSTYSHTAQAAQLRSSQEPPEMFSETHSATEHIQVAPISESTFNPGSSVSPYETIEQYTGTHFLTQNESNSKKDEETAEATLEYAGSQINYMQLTATRDRLGQTHDTLTQTHDSLGQTHDTRGQTDETLGQIHDTRGQTFKSQQSQQLSDAVTKDNKALFQPSSTSPTLVSKNVYEDDDDDDESITSDAETATEYITVSYGEVPSQPSVTLFSSMPLSISKTTKELLHSAFDVQQKFDNKHAATRSGVSSSQEGTFSWTQRASAGNYADDGGDDGQHSIKPAPPTHVLYEASSYTKSSPTFTSDADLDLVMKPASAEEVQDLINTGTSAQCRSLTGSGITCHFQNLCYNVVEHDFMFLRGSRSIIEQELPISDMQEDPGGLFDLSLSAVSGHNGFKFLPVFLPSDSLNKFSSVTLLQQKFFIMQRFKPDNIMHVLHEDILPLHHTLDLLNLIQERQKPNVTLLFSDTFDADEHVDFYEALSNGKPFSLRNLHQPGVVCLADSYIGLSNATLWYQYGFLTPQGPLTADDPNLLINIRKAARYLAGFFNETCKFCEKRNYLVLLSRKDNRLILNEGDLMMSLARSTKLKVMSVSMETHSLSEIIAIIQNSRGLMGMHGSLLAFSIFLPIDSLLVELFPYAVNASKYTPFRTVSNLPGSRIVYKSWTNPSRDKSVPHPDWIPALGGILHLPLDLQKTIERQSDVPDHLCCEDPSWLYHIYQDTEVDVAAVTSLTLSALNETKHMQARSPPASKLVRDIPVLPGPIKDLTCAVKNFKNQNGKICLQYFLSWRAPWNLEFLQYISLEYNLVISQRGGDRSWQVELPSSVTSYLLDGECQRPLSAYDVWVRASVGRTSSGPYVYMLCKDNT